MAGLVKCEEAGVFAGFSAVLADENVGRTCRDSRQASRESSDFVLLRSVGREFSSGLRTIPAGGPAGWTLKFACGGQNRCGRRGLGGVGSGRTRLSPGSPESAFLPRFRRAVADRIRSVPASPCGEFSASARSKCRRHRLRSGALGWDGQREAMQRGSQQHSLDWLTASHD